MKKIFKISFFFVIINLKVSEFMGGIDFLDKFESAKKYLKYLFLLIPIIILFILFKGCNSNRSTYNDLENKVKKEVINYVNNNHINVIGEVYIELSKLDKIEGTELCSKASGAIVKRVNGSLEVTPYLKCNDYESEIVKNNKSQYVELNGDPVIILNYGEAFNDPLYEEKAYDIVVTVNGAVGKAPGVYTLTYYVYENEALRDKLYRKVIISESDKTDTISGITDVNIPVLTLKGDTEITLYKGERFEEPSWTAYDYTDGVLNTKVKRTITYNNKTVNRVDTSKTGIYRILYSVTNSKGNTAYKSRVINVIEKSLDLKVNLSSNTNEIASNATITINITGKDYAYMYLPSGEKTTERTRTITVKENRTYTFNVYDQYGTRYDKEIEISNLDNIPPTGTCKALVSSRDTEITVNATDNKGVASYVYIVNGESSDATSNNTYKLDKVATSAKVKIKDIALNEATINCTLEKKSIVTAASRCKPSDVYITINTCFLNQTIRKNVPLEEYLVGVLYAEMGTGYKNEEDLLKAFVIFARSFTLNRIRYWDGKNRPIRSCSSDQNWCDPDMGCYRDQTQEMFDACIQFSIDYSSGYSALTCANRLTTYPGQANVTNKTFYVNNPNWRGDMSTTSTGVRSSWKAPLSASRKAYLKKIVDETAGLIIYRSENESAGVGYYVCGSGGPEKNKNIFCQDDAIKKASQGYNMEELIEAYTTYKKRTVDCYNK